jgi:hypothetical protein
VLQKRAESGGKFTTSGGVDNKRECKVGFCPGKGLSMLRPRVSYPQPRAMGAATAGVMADQRAASPMLQCRRANLNAEQTPACLDTHHAVGRADALLQA